MRAVAAALSLVCAGCYAEHERTDPSACEVTPACFPDAPTLILATESDPRSEGCQRIRLEGGRDDLGCEDGPVTVLRVVRCAGWATLFFVAVRDTAGRVGELGAERASCTCASFDFGPEDVAVGEELVWAHMGSDRADIEVGFFGDGTVYDVVVCAPARAP